MKEDKTKRLVKRLMDFKAEDIKIKRTKKAHGYKYSPLDKIAEVVDPFLIKHGISYYHTTGFDDVQALNYLETTIVNVDDEKDKLVCRTCIKEDIKLPGQNAFMVLGSAITYFRRYHFVMMLGLSTEGDSDAGGATTSNKRNNTAKDGDPIDYAKIFTDFISKGKTEIAVKKAFDTHKGKMTPEVLKVVSAMIETKFEDKAK